jgi:hypothetical protein
MLVGNPKVLAIESGIAKPLPALSERALGHFVLHVGGRAYGNPSPTATLLACSFDQVGRRLERKGTHLAPFSSEPAADIVRSVVKVKYQGYDAADRFFSMSPDAFDSALTLSKICWAPDGDAAFDDGGNVLHFDLQDEVRLIAFKNEADVASILPSVADVRLPASAFYGVLDEWHARFEAEWINALRSAINH